MNETDAETVHEEMEKMSPPSPKTREECLEKAVAPLYCGSGVVIGYSPEINGGTSRRVTAVVTLFDLLLMARHWVGELDEVFDTFDMGYSGSREIRMDVWASRRIGEIVDALRPAVDQMVAGGISDGRSFEALKDVRDEFVRAFRPMIEGPNFEKPNPVDSMLERMETKLRERGWRPEKERE